MARFEAWSEAEARGGERQQRVVAWRSIVVLTVVLALAGTSSSSSRSLCTNNNLSWLPGDNTTETPGLCGATPYVCEPPEPGAVSYSLVNPACDPQVSSCSMRADVPVEFPGNRTNPHGGMTVFAAIELYDSSGSLVGACGLAGTPISRDTGTARVTRPAACENPEDARYRVRFRTCLGGGSCEYSESVFVDLDAAAGCLRPPTWGCGEGDTASAGACCLGPGGGAPAVGGGGPPSDSERGATSAVRSGPLGASYALPGSAPAGMKLHYQFGGAGGPGYPENASWRRSLGMHWSHEFAQRIVPWPDEARVWLVTKSGSFREFEDPDENGVYRTTRPSDEYRRLEWSSGSGWVLHELNGTSSHFLANGLWDKTVDRTGRAIEGSYTDGNLGGVTFPDGRSLSFAYGSDGKLASITETPVAGTGDSPRTWSYVWQSGTTGIQSLQLVTMPDGKRWRMAYDGQVPPHLTRVRIQQAGGTGALTRVEAAWEYNANGELVRAWRGAESFADGAAWDKVSWTYVSAAEAQIEDAYGNVTAFTFEREGGSGKPRVTAVSGPCPTCGISPGSSIEYDNPGNPGHPSLPWRITNGEGTVTELVYDARGRVTSRTEALGTALERTTQFEYAEGYPAFVSRIEQPSVVAGCGSNRTVVRSYDPATGNLESETRLGCEIVGGVPQPLADDVTLYDYTGTAGGSPTAIDPPGFGTADLTTLTYDEDRGGRVLLSRTEPLVGTTSFGYDGFNRRTSVTDINGVVTTTAYDAMDRVTSITREGATPAQDEVTGYFYNAFGDLFCVKLPRGNGIEHNYDSAGRRTVVARGTAVAAPTATGCLATGSRRERTQFTFDAGGQVVREEQQFCASGTCSGGWTTEARADYEYSSSCHLDRSKRAKTLDPTFATTEYAYDCNGSLTAVWDANHPAPGPASSVFKYDALGRLVEVRQPWGPTAEDCDPDEPDDPDCAITRYEYSGQDHLVRVLDAEGNETSYVYDDRDVLAAQESQATGLTDYEYNLHRELVKETDARGVVTHRTMDAADRIAYVDYADDAFDVAYAYGTEPDGVYFTRGRLREMVRDPEGESPLALEFRYDRFGRATRDGEMDFTFDRNGNPLTIAYPGGVVASYTYDFADREATLSVDAGGGARSVVTASSYRANGPLAGLAFGTTPGRTETRGHDAGYLPLSIAVSNGLLAWSYTLDEVGNVTGVSQTQPDSGSRSFGYQDLQYYLTCAAGPWAAGSACGPASGGALEWSYDKIGNRLGETRSGWTDAYGYHVNPAGGNSPRLEAIALGVGGWRAYAFGAAGHLEAIDAGANPVLFEPDPAGQLGGVSRAEDRVASFRYDGRGFLAEAVASSPASRGTAPGRVPGSALFADGFESGDVCAWSRALGWSGPACGPPPVESRLVPLYDSGGRLHALFPAGDPAQGRYVFSFAGRPVAILRREAEPVWTFLTTDHLGTPVHAMDGTGTTTWLGGFEPFGRDWQVGAASASANGVFLRLPGQWVDPLWEDATLGTEVFYNVHRWYEQQTGRYTRADPLGLRSGAHLYNYVLNNPLRFFDPLGLKAAQACGFTWVGTLGAVGDMNNQVIFCAPCECGPKKINGVGFGDDPPPPPGVEAPAGIASVPSTPSIPFTTYDRCRCSSNDKVYVNVQTRRSLIAPQFFSNAAKVNLDYDCPRDKK